MLQKSESEYCRGRAGAGLPLVYDSYIIVRKKQSLTLNHEPQLGPQHRHHHDEVWKNGISYAVGLMRSIAYHRICLVNRKTVIVAKMTPHLGINSKREAGEYVRYPFLVILLGCIVLRLCVLR
jgi:hypothetical protein